MRTFNLLLLSFCFPTMLLLSSCAHNGTAQSRPSRLIRMRPYGTSPLEGYSKENYTPAPRPPKALASQAPLTQAGEYAPIIKSQQYAQVPREIIQMPEIHNVDSYSPSVQEVKFNLVPVTSYPAKGYYPNPSKAYVPDTVVAPGQRQGNEEAPVPGQSRVQRRLVTVQSEGENVTGYARTLGIISREQKEQAQRALITADGEEALYINGIGWVGFIPQN
jgi:hypothetical protein